MATHSSTLVWRIPRTEESGGLESMGSQSQTRLSTQGHGQLDNGPTHENPEGFVANNKTRWANHVLFPFAGSKGA